MEANPAEGVLSKGPHVRTLRPLESRGLFWDPQRARYPLSARALGTTPLRSVLAAFGPRGMILPSISGQVPYWNSTCPVTALIRTLLPSEQR